MCPVAACRGPGRPQCAPSPPEWSISVPGPGPSPTLGPRISMPVLRPVQGTATGPRQSPLQRVTPPQPPVHGYTARHTHLCCNRTAGPPEQQQAAHGTADRGASPLGPPPRGCERGPPLTQPGQPGPPMPQICIPLSMTSHPRTKTYPTRQRRAPVDHRTPFVGPPCSACARLQISRRQLLGDTQPLASLRAHCSEPDTLSVPRCGQIKREGVPQSVDFPSPAPRHAAGRPVREREERQRSSLVGVLSSSATTSTKYDHRRPGRRTRAVSSCHLKERMK